MASIGITAATPAHTPRKSMERGYTMTQNRTTTDMWTYRDQQSWGNTDITGFNVEALDGGIGSIDEASTEIGGSYLVVDTGPWIFGKKVLLPAGVIDRVDVNDERVYVNRTKEQIENAPEFDEDRYRDEGYRSDVGTYYDEGGRGYREW
jgi:hypothetical protein